MQLLQQEIIDETDQYVDNLQVSVMVTASAFEGFNTHLVTRFHVLACLLKGLNPSS